MHKNIEAPKVNIKERPKEKNKPQYNNNRGL